MNNPAIWKIRLKWLVMGLASVLLLAALAYFGIFNFLLNWELETLTIRQQLYASTVRSHKDTTPIRLITLDPKSLSAPVMNRMFGRVKDSRSSYAYIVRYLKRGKPKKIVIDTAFNGGPDLLHPEEDRVLLDTVRGMENLYSVLLFDITRLKDTSWEFYPEKTREQLRKHTVYVHNLEKYPLITVENNYPSMVPPFPAMLESSMKYGSSFYMYFYQQPNIDTTATIRRWVPFTMYGDRAYPAIQLAMVSDGQKEMSIGDDHVLDWGTGSIPLGRDGAPLIKWYGHHYIPVNGSKPPVFVYPEFPFSRVVTSELSLECKEGTIDKKLCAELEIPEKPPIPVSYFDNQYVIIGLTFTNSGDHHKTIFGSYYPGVYILANALDNLLNRDFVYEAPMWANAGIVVLFALLALYCCLRFQSVIFVAVGLVSVGVVYSVATYVAYAQANLWINLVYPLLAMIVTFSVTYAWRFLKAERKRQQLQYAFGKYVSPAVLTELEKNPEALKLGGHRRELTLLFCDIRGFTTFSESQTPESVQGLLTRYFSVMNGIIMNRFQGSINKLIGDAIMAYWGFPIRNQDHAYLAVCAALAMKDAVEEWNRNPDNAPLHIGIGVNTGDVVIGNVGSDEFMDFTVIGDAVNLASRLESLNKEFGTTIIVSAETADRVRDRIEFRSLGTVTVRGKEQETEIYEPLGLITARPMAKV